MAFDEELAGRHSIDHEPPQEMCGKEDVRWRRLLARQQHVLWRLERVSHPASWTVGL